MSKKNGNVGKVVKSHSMGIAAKGVQSAEDARMFLYGAAADIGMGTLDPERAHPIARLLGVAAQTHANQNKEREIALREREQARRELLLAGMPPVVVAPKQLA